MYEPKLIDKGRSGCIFHPNISCNGEHENMNYV